MLIAALKTFSQRFARDTRGSVLMLFGLSIIFLVGIGGAGVDLGTQQLQRVKLQMAADAAATSAASLVPTSAANATSERQNAANRYFNLNYPPTLFGQPRPTPIITLTGGAGNGTVTVTANSDVATSFVSNFGIPTLASAGSATAGLLEVNAAKYDVILSMDNSGSMSAPAGGGLSRIAALKNAANTLIDKFLPLTTTHDNRMAFNRWNHDIINSVGFSADNPSSKAYINNMTIGGNTNSAAGLGNAMSMQPQTRSDAVKTVILLTDGVNGVGAGTTGPINAASLGICDGLKNQQVVIYTIGFGASVVNDAGVIAFLSACATPNPAGGSNTNVYFFPAANTAQLNAAFDIIATSIRSVRISN